MGRFLDAAYKVLKMEGRGLTAVALTKEAIECKLLVTQGKSPAQTMKSKISTDILKYKEKSRFIRIDAGLFGLREWAGEAFVAPRYKKSLFDEDILVFDRCILSEFISHNGFNARDLRNVFGRLNEASFEMRRREAEADESVIQLISVFIVKHKNEYLTYKRSKRLPESRLHDYYSIMFGGHILPRDWVPLLNSTDVRIQSDIIKRELSEELILECDPTLHYRGLLYDDSRPVSKIHLGIVYDVFLPGPRFKVGEKGFLVDPKFERIEDISQRIGDFENWSQIIIKEELRKSEGKETSHESD